MNAIGRKKPTYDRYGNLWRFIGKNSVVSPQVTGALAAAIGTTLTLASQGVPIKILANQALRLTRYQCSVTQVGAPSFSILAQNGAFQYITGPTPFVFANGVFGFNAMSDLSSNTSGAINGQYVDNVGVNFDLVDDWLEWDDTLVGGANSLTQASGILLQTQWSVQNATAVARTVAANESAAWEIWESTRG